MEGLGDLFKVRMGILPEIPKQEEPEDPKAKNKKSKKDDKKKDKKEKKDKAAEAEENLPKKIKWFVETVRNRCCTNINIYIYDFPVSKWYL